MNRRLPRNFGFRSNSKLCSVKPDSPYGDKVNVDLNLWLSKDACNGARSGQQRPRAKASDNDEIFDFEVQVQLTLDEVIALQERGEIMKKLRLVDFDFDTEDNFNNLEGISDEDLKGFTEEELSRLLT